MRQLHYFMLTVLLVCIGCQPNDEVLEETSIENQPESLFSKGTTEEEPPLTETELLEAKMQWLTYFAAKAMYADSQVKNEVASFLTTDNTVSLDDLFDNPSSSHFEDAIRDLLLERFSGGKEDGEPKTPPGVAVPTCCGEPEYMTDQLIAYWAEDHCIELYFPGGIDTTSAGAKMTSTAHPLTTFESNYGFERGSTDDGKVTHATINELTLTLDPHTIVMARLVPTTVPNPASNTCSYDEFSGIDFTNFLNGIFD